MEKILNQHHNKDTFIFALTRLFERAAYYGLRALIVLYMVGETFDMSNEEAFEIYGWLILALLISGIIGALLGDLVIGNKTTMIIGAALQMAGAQVICTPSINALYGGLVLVVIGGGLYSPNLKSNFGRLYLEKTKLLDSAYLILYIAANVGAFIGVLSIGYVGEKISYNAGFSLAAVFMFFALILSVYTKELTSIKAVKFDSITPSKLLKIALAFISFGLFWLLYEFAGASIFELNRKILEVSGVHFSYQFSTQLNTFFLIPLGVILVFVWSYYHSNPIVKLAFGFIAGSIGYGLLFIIPESPSTIHFSYFIISAFFLVVAELLVSPIIDTIITKFCHPKYLAIVMSLLFLPYRALYFVFGFSNGDFTPLSQYAFAICAVGMLLISMGIFLFTVIDNDSDNREQVDYYNTESKL